MQESTYSTSTLNASRWFVTWNTVAQHRLWIGLLIAIGSLSSVLCGYWLSVGGVARRLLMRGNRSVYT